MSTKRSSPFKGTVKSLGLVFGDIGTSPIYTLTVVFLLTQPTEQHVIGVLSLIFWTLVLLVTVQLRMPTSPRNTPMPPPEPRSDTLPVTRQLLTSPASRQ